MSRALILVLSLTFATLGLSACGKRGTLEPPAAAPVEKSSASVEPKTNEKPHRPFVLDGLLR
jgi:predicted small lipoprotein YifL